MYKPLIGSAYFVSEEQLTPQFLGQQGVFLIAMTDEKDVLAQLPMKPVMGTVLLPNYESMIYLMDNKFDEFSRMYYAHLTYSQEANDLLTILTTSVLMLDSRIMIFISSDEMQLGFHRVLRDYVLNNYGILIGGPDSQFGYSNNFDIVNLSRMYCNDYIDMATLLIQYPTSVPVDESSVQKILYEHPDFYIRDGYTPQQAVTLYKENIKKAGNVYLERGLVKNVSDSF
jgi:hypothetical protein